MKSVVHFFQTPTGQLVAVGALAAAALAVVAWQRAQRPPVVAKATPTSTPPASLPKVFHRPGSRFESPSVPATAHAASTPPIAAKPAAPPVLPLAVFSRATANQPHGSSSGQAPYGRLIPCETVVSLESNRLDTPIIGLVTADIFENGRCVIPAGTEVHGRAALDRTRDRLAATGTWVLVRRDPRVENGRELRVQGIALDRDETNGDWGPRDGSAGLRGELVRADQMAEAKLFAATFLTTATNALQDTRSSASAFGESLVPAATARNAALSGTSAVLREYARELRESISRDGFHLRVPAGKPFYLYVTEPIAFTPATASASRYETR